MLAGMHDTNAEDAWRALDIDALEACNEAAEDPVAQWQSIALALCRRLDALDCMAALDALASCPPTTVLAGRSVEAWIALGEAFVDANLLSLGVDARYGKSVEVSVPLFHSSAVVSCIASLAAGAADYEMFSSELLGSDDPLLWFEGAPLLARLAILRGDAATLRKVHEGAKATYKAAPWFGYLDEQASLHEQAAGMEAAAANDSFFATRENSEANAVLRMLGSPDEDAVITSLAGIRERLDGGRERSAILRLDREQLKEFLAAGATVIVHEERPVHPGFAKLCGFDDETGIVLADSMLSPGRELRQWREQEVRMALYGSSALIVANDKTFALQHDSGLATLGVTETTQHDPELGRARQEQLAQQAVESCADVPRAWQLHGQALFAQLAAEELQGENADGPMEQWYGNARTHFAKAEWAHQVYAQALEYWGQFEEAAIAWNDAYSLDSHDARNLLGIARTRAREGLVNAAIPYARRALCADPTALDAWRLRAELASSSQDGQVATQAASIVLQAEPNDPTAHRIIGAQAERDGALEQALEHFDSASEGGDGSQLARASILAARLGDFEGAKARALAVLDIDPETYANHLRASECFVRIGASEDAIGILEYAISRFGPHEALVLGYASRIVDLLPQEECAQRVHAFVESWAEYEQPLTTLGTSLSGAGLLELAVVCFEGAHRAGPDSLNPTWQQVQSYLRHDRRDEATELLKGMLEKTSLPHAHAIWTELQGASAPDACWESLGKADAESDPVLVWASARYLAEERGDEDAVSGLSERLLGVPMSALGSALGFLVQSKAMRLAGDLMPVVEKHRDAKEGRENTLHVQALYAYEAGAFDKAADLLGAMHEEFPTSTVTWQELDIVREAGNADLLRLLGEKALQRLLRGSPESFGDGFTERAHLAAAEILVGDYEPMERMLAEHPHCIPLLECASLASFAANRELSDRCFGKLLEVAPGRAQKIERKRSGEKGANV